MSMSSNKRAENWTKSESSRLVDLCLENAEILDASLRDVDTNRKKKAAWKAIHAYVNSINPNANRSLDEVKMKWKNLKKKAKHSFDALKRSTKPTGGGPSEEPLDSTMNAILDVYGTSPSFAGIPGGLEAGTGKEYSGDESEEMEEESQEKSMSSEESKAIKRRKVKMVSKKVETTDFQQAMIDVEKEKLNLKKEKLEFARQKLKLKSERFQEKLKVKSERIQLEKEKWMGKREKLFLQTEYFKFKSQNANQNPMHLDYANIHNL